MTTPRKRTTAPAPASFECRRCKCTWTLPEGEPPPAFCPRCGRRDWAVDPYTPKLLIVPRAEPSRPED